MAAKPTIPQVQALVKASRFAEAARLLIAAADAGEREALAELAQWRIAGNIVRRDLAAARNLLQRAGEAGNPDAALLHTSFLASGVGGASDWPAALTALTAMAPSQPRAAEQLRLLRAMDLGPDGSPAHKVEGRTLSRSPHVVAADGLLTATECAYLVERGQPGLQPSMVVDPNDGRLVPNPIRTSDGAHFGVYDEDLAINALNRRIAAFSDTRIEQGEPMQLLRYRPGQEYRAHVDALPAEANQRVATVLVYLSDDYEGGETVFVRTGLSFRGRVGDALLFRNVTPDGRPDPMALHAGRPVTRGVKLIASRWIRAQAFSYPPPRPLVNR
jgi:prolyl 4-hydroxylase